MIRIGILGAAGYTGGELIRVLTNHPEAEIVFANSESNAGNLVSDVHEGLVGECSLRFTSEMPFADVDVVFFCFGHGKSEQFLAEHQIPQSVRIIDLAQDFRIGLSHESGEYIYGLPEAFKDKIRGCRKLANPGCFATAVQLSLLPLAAKGLLTHDVSVNAITGSTGAGQKPGATTHFSWRVDNISTYKVFTHQHLHEIRQTLKELSASNTQEVDFIPYRGNFSRGIFCTSVVRLDEDIDVAEIYRQYYASATFTHYSDKALDLKQVVNTNKALVHVDQFGRKAVVTSIIDNLLKGAVGQAVENMNLMFGLCEKAGLNLKANAF